MMQSTGVLRGGTLKVFRIWYFTCTLHFLHVLSLKPQFLRDQNVTNVCSNLQLNHSLYPGKIIIYTKINPIYDVFNAAQLPSSEIRLDSYYTREMFSNVK